MIVFSAPGRCGIVGTPSDMYGGNVLSISTLERATCTIIPAETLTLDSSGDQLEIRNAVDLAPRGDKLDLPRAVLRWFNLDPATSKFQMRLATDIPMQAGIAGSTALVVAAVGAMNEFLHLGLHPWNIAEIARKVESLEMKVLCGLQDQHMAVFGGINYMNFAGKEQLEQNNDEPLATIEPLGHFCQHPPLIAAHTGVPHHSGTVHKSLRQRWLDGDREVIQAIRRIASLAPLGKRALLDADWDRLGNLMNENHTMIQELGGSGPENDRLIQLARDAGAFGAKLAGAGGGGTILVLASNRDEIALALKLAGADKIMFPSPCPGLTAEATNIMKVKSI